jgi:Zn-dependent protease with chaperone function
MQSKSPSLAGRALLALLLTVGFYGLALLLAGILLFVIYAEVRWAHRINIRLTLFCLIGAVTILWAILPRIDRFRAPGPRLEPGEQPRLYGEIESLAQKTGQAMPVDVYLTADVNAGVAQRGGLMGIGSRRVMLLGLPLLQVLTVPQLRGVLAHEFGHFYGGDTKLGPWIYKTRSAIVRTVQGLSGGWLQAPFMWYAKMFLRVTNGISRRQEFVADELAARTVGAGALAEGLRRVHGVAPTFEGYMRTEYLPALGAGVQPPLAEGFQRFVMAEPVTHIIQQIVETEAASEKSDPYDTHPTLGERLAALQALPLGPETNDTTLAVALLKHVPAMENLLLAHLFGQQRSQQLRPVAWDELGPTVMLPSQEKLVQTFADALNGITAADLPAVLHSPPRALTTQITQSAEGTPSPADIERAAGTVLGAALLVSLAHRGWTLNTGPGLPVSMRKGDLDITPWQITDQLTNGNLSAEAWRERCQAAAITDLRLDGK